MQRTQNQEPKGSQASGQGRQRQVPLPGKGLPTGNGLPTNKGQNQNRAQGNRSNSNSKIKGQTGNTPTRRSNSTNGKQLNNSEESKNQNLVPDERKLMGLGSLTGFEKEFYDHMEKSYKKIESIQPGEWLHSHPEKGQSYERYTQYCKPLTKDPKIIYMIPLDNVPVNLIARLERMANGFYQGFQVKVLKSFDISKEKKIRRRNQTTDPNYIQYNCFDILDFLMQLRPADGFCLVGFLISDLYPKEEWNFVFGWGDPQRKTGVFSFARYHDSFYKQLKFPNYEGLDDFCTVTYRACRIVIHELGHLFGLAHCRHFQCLMNGINSLEELETKPFEICPGCLRKLVYRLNSNAKTIFVNFQKALNDIGEGPFGAQAILIQSRIKEIFD